MVKNAGSGAGRMVMVLWLESMVVGH
jgi:hypothetical protein